MKPSVKELFEKYRNNLYAAAFNICGNAADAEDVVKDTFIQYYLLKKEFDNEQHIRAWLIRVAINKAKNTNRTFWRRNKVPLEDYMETLTFETPESEELFETVMKLPEKYRIVIYLHYYEGYTFPEIAAFLKISPSGVSMRVHRAKKLLKKQLCN